MGRRYFVLAPPQTEEVDFFAVGQIYRSKEGETVLEALDRIFPNGCKTALDLFSGELVEQPLMQKTGEARPVAAQRTVNDPLSSRIRSATFV